jgi:hypothetical protein
MVVADVAAGVAIANSDEDIIFFIVVATVTHYRSDLLIFCSSTVLYRLAPSYLVHVDRAAVVLIGAF